MRLPRPRALPLRHKRRADQLCGNQPSLPGQPAGAPSLGRFAHRFARRAAPPSSPEFLTFSWGYIRGGPPPRPQAGGRGQVVAGYSLHGYS